MTTTECGNGMKNGEGIYRDSKVIFCTMKIIRKYNLLAEIL